MENNYESAKGKFGALMSRLHENGFRDDFITKTVLEHPFFSCFEDNRIEKFLRTPLEEIIRNAFHKDNAYIDFSLPYISEYYWAGEMYFMLLSRYEIPLERSFLIYPLGKMVERYSPYHEMSESQLAEQYLSDEQRIGVFRSLRNLRGLSIRELSVLTGIKPPTLTSYSKNEILWNASFRNIALLSEAFHVRNATFQKASSFCLVPQELFHYDGFRKEFLRLAALYFGTPEDTPTILDHQTDTEIASLAKKYHRFFYLPDFALIQHRGKVTYRFLEEKEIRMLARQAKKAL